jgi:hypothetical protein
MDCHALLGFTVSKSVLHHVVSGAAQDYDIENTSPYGTDEQTYASAFNTWQIEQVC